MKIDNWTKCTKDRVNWKVVAETAIRSNIANVVPEEEEKYLMWLKIFDVASLELLVLHLLFG
jgi:hypothetical protein